MFVTVTCACIISTADDSCQLADIVFVLDSSGSIGLADWDRVLNFTKSIVSDFVIGSNNVHIGVNYYGNSAILAFNLDTYDTEADVMDAIDGIPWLDQNTNTSGGIRLMHRDMFTVGGGKSLTYRVMCHNTTHRSYVIIPPHRVICHIIPSHRAICHIIPSQGNMLYNTITQGNMLYNTIPQGNMSYNTITQGNMSYNTTTQGNMLYNTITGQYVI